MVKPTVPTAAAAAQTWATITPTRSAQYVAGVKAPKTDWANATAAAAPNYKAAISAANIQQKFAGGVKQAGTSKWQTKAATLGGDRFGPGVQAAQSDYQAGEDPYLATIAGVDMSDRQPRGNPANIQRVAQIDAALTAKRQAMKTASA